MSIPPVLDELLRAPGVSGREDAVQAIVRREAAALGATVETDVLGSTVARVSGTGEGRLVALFAHADQIGLVVRGVDDDGLLTMARLGSWRPQDAVGQRVRIVTDAGEVRGVVAAPHDIGELTWDVLRSVAADPPVWDVALVVSVQEETSHGGANVVVERLAPDVAIVVDVSYAGDAPGTAPWDDVRLGGGPTVFRGPVVSPGVGDGLLEAAAAGIEVAVESGTSTWSDADDIFSAAGGTACQIVCIPLRYMHTAGEIAQLSDVTATSRLLETYIRSLTTESTFLR